jgi:Thioesterase-like superfamily
MPHEDGALFQLHRPSTFVPTSAAVGPWDPNIVHGAAVAALFAGQLTPTEGTLARLTLEILAPVPLVPLTLECSQPSGGVRAQRQTATLSAEGRTVATASTVLVRRGDLELPESARQDDSPFHPAEVPALDEPNRAAAATVGRDSFDSGSAVVQPMRVEGDRRVHQWISLILSVVEGTELQPTEIAAVAADYAQAAVHRVLPFSSWSFRNAELTIHFAREPVGSWVGMRCESALAPVGAGFNTADLYDADGRMGRSAAVLVVERREVSK